MRNNIKGALASMNLIRRYWRIIFPIIIGILIWALSDHNGDTSAGESNTIADILGISNGLARKLAHFVLYGAMGYGIASFIKGLHPVSFPKLTQIMYPIIVTVIYGAIDEVHQLTVMGRNGSAKDVILDALAGVAGTFVYIIIFCFIRMRRNKRSLVNNIIEEQKENAEQIIIEN